MSTAVQQKPIVFGVEQDVSKAPEIIELFKAGSWNTEAYGDLDITIQDIDEAIEHFDAGIYRANNGTEPLPGTLDHLGGATPAAFRMHRLYRIEDSLMADVKWTKRGKQALEDDDYRYISVEFHTRSMPLKNPLNTNDVMPNVVTGATLTNDPLFKDQKSLLASARSGRGDKSNQGEVSMDLATLRAKKKDELSEEELKFVTEHQAELTEDERKEFGLVEAGETEEQKKAREEAEAKKAEEEEAAKKAAAEEEEKKKLEASAGLKGTVQIDAQELAQLRAGAAAGLKAQNDLLRTQLTASVRSHVDRGAIKSDKADEAVEILMASSPSMRTRIQSFMESLNGNALLASARGSSAEASEVSLTAEDKKMAAAFGNSEEDLEKFKKAEAAKEGK